MIHAAILSRKYKSYVANDVTLIPHLFKEAISGKYHNETRWISREDYKQMKDKDLYVRFSWSFGNNGISYLYSREIEPYKRACHYAVVFDDFGPLSELCPEVWRAAQLALRGQTNLRTRRLLFGPAIVKRLKELRDPSLIDKNPLYASCHKRSRPDATYLQSLERLQSLEIITGDYRGIEIRPGDIIYCDPPYKDTAGYNKSDFDHEAFYDWVEAQPVPVFVSEYNMPEDRFMCIWRKKTTQRLSKNGSSFAEERLYVKRPKSCLKK